MFCRRATKIINEARTLLLNESGSVVPSPGFLEEFIDPQFQPLKVPTYIASVQRVLFGDKAERGYKNAVVKALMTVLHSTEFVAYVTALDPRVTYLEHQSAAQTKDNLLIVPTSATWHPADTVGVPVSNAGQPRANWTWTVKIVSGGPAVFGIEVKLEQEQRVQFFEVQFQTYNSDGLLSDLIPLVGQPNFFFRIIKPPAASVANMNINLSGKVYTTAPISVGESWNVNLLTVPTVDVSALYASLVGLGNAITGRLFVPREAPYLVFESLWRQHPEINYRLSGLLLALIYQLEGLRNNG